MEFSFEPLTRPSFPLLIEWLAKPHVNKWWPEPAANMKAVEKEYGEGIDGKKTNEAYIALIDNEPIGLIQSYKVEDYPEHALSVKLDNAIGVDLFIGEDNLIGKGLGPAMLTQFIRGVILKIYPEADYIVADPEVINTASIRAFEKAGFYKGDIVDDDQYGPEQLMIFKLSSMKV